MAVSKQEVILEFNADTGKAEKNVKGLQDGMEGVANAAVEAADATEDIGNSAGKAGSGFKKLGKLGSQGFKVVGAAIAASGIGLLLKIIQPIVDAFLENKTVAEALEVAMAGVGAVINSIVVIGEKVVEVLMNAFTNPQEAITKLKDLIVQNITNRIKGLLNLLPRLGEAISQVFKGNFKEAGKIATNAVAQVTLGVENFTDKVGAAAEAATEFVKETVSAAIGATKLQKALQDLADRERELSVETARQAAAIEELKRQRDDERLSIEKRIKFAQEAAAIDQRIADENTAIQEKKARLLRQEIELQGETEERVQALAAAEIAAAEARRASAAVQAELAASIYDLNQQAIEQQEEKAQAEREAALEILRAQQELEDELYALRLSAREQEELAAMQEYDRRIAIAGDDEGLIKAATEQLNADLAEIDKTARETAREKELEDAETLAQAKRDVAKSSLEALAALNDAFGGASVERAEKIANLEDAISEAQDEREKNRLIAQRDDLAKIQDEEGRKQFERSKKIQAAQALISTYESAVQAFKSLAGIPVVGPALGSAAAAAAVAAGLANVKNIRSQTFSGSASEPDVPNTEGITAAASGGGAASTAPQLDLSFLGQGAGQVAPVQAYVLAENVSNAQQANQKIQDQATL
jgi:hypothetical protein